MITLNPDLRVKLLREARDIVSRGWCQNAWARDSFGACVDSDSWHATTFCVTGAIGKAYRNYFGSNLDLSDQIYLGGELGAEFALGGVADEELSGLLDWNDHDDRTQQEVVDRFDRAIDRLTPTYLPKVA